MFFALHSKLIRTFCFNNPATFTGTLFVPVFFIMFPVNPVCPGLFYYVSGEFFLT